MMRKALIAASLLAIAPALAQAPAESPPEKQLTITLPVSAWNTIMQALGREPYMAVQDLISKMQAQAKQQLEPSVKAEKRP